MHPINKRSIFKICSVSSLLFLGVLCVAHAQSTSTQATKTAQTLSSSTPTTQTIHGYPAEKQKRLTDLTANVSNRIDAAITRLSDINRRIKSRAEIVAASGIDVSDTLGNANDAQTMIDAVRNDMKDIDAQVALTVSSPQPRTDWLNILGTLTEAKSRLIRAKEKMQTAIDFLRQKTSNSNNTATTTSTQNQQTSSSTAGTGTSTINQ